MLFVGKKWVVLCVLYFFITIESCSQYEKIVVSYIDAISKMVLWPKEPQQEFVISVLGHSSSTPFLTKKYARKRPKKVRKQKIVLLVMKTLSEYRVTNILFTEIKDVDQLRFICDDLRTTQTLIVTAVPGFNEGPTINIDFENNFEMEINEDKIAARGIRLSPVLLEIGKVL